VALARRSGQRFQASIWPSFVDVMTSLLLVLMFVLTVFMIVQYILRETISGQATELDQLSAQVASLADALGLERNRAAALEGELGELNATLAQARGEIDAQTALIARLNADIAAGEAERAALTGRIEDFEAQVAALLSERDVARGEAAALQEERASLETALAAARSEIDAGAEAARLAAARREALQALIADLRRRAEESGAEAFQLQRALSEEAAARLADAEAARLLRERLQGAETELTAMTLALEEQRRRAEETLTLLAAAEAARDALQAEVTAGAAAMSLAERDAALRAVAEAKLAEQEAVSAEAERRVALLNEQIAALRSQLGELQGLLDAAAEKDRAADVQIEALGSQLNVALAQVAAEQRRRAELEEAERKRLEAEAKSLVATAEELERYRSEFFGRLREILAGREGVRVVGDRFVFSSEVLFQTGAADLAPEGRAQIASVAALLLDVAEDIPPGLQWILRVDGHTDDVPIAPGARFADNWELSQARALSVVRYMVDELGFAPDRLAATGFGEYQPVAQGDSPEARAQNRRIELKLTER
jgi:chemotaxis protein MotB